MLMEFSSPLGLFHDILTEPDKYASAVVCLKSIVRAAVLAALITLTRWSFGAWILVFAFLWMQHAKVMTKCCGPFMARILSQRLAVGNAYITPVTGKTLNLMPVTDKTPNLLTYYHLAYLSSCIANREWDNLPPLSWLSDTISNEVALGTELCQSS